MRIGWQAVVAASQVTNAPSLIFLICCLPVKTTLDRSGGKGSQGMDDWLAGGRQPLSWAFFVTGGKYALLCHRTTSIFVR